MFYAGDEYADDDCTSGPVEWCDQFTIFDDDDTDEDGNEFDEDGNEFDDESPVYEIDHCPFAIPAWGDDR